MRVYYLFFSLIMFLFIFGCSNKQSEIDVSKYEKELSVHAQQYMKELKTVLVKNLKSGGPLQAVSVCSDTAQEMTKKYSDKNGIQIKRVSFKNRNLSNTPDNFEKKAIQYFEELNSNNSLTKEINLIELIDEDDDNIVKFAKPILVDAPCLNCHGSEGQIAKEVLEVISAKYPNDKATGYKIGDLRGIISVSKKLTL